MLVDRGAGAVDVARLGQLRQFHVFRAHIPLAPPEAEAQRPVPVTLAADIERLAQFEFEERGGAALRDWIDACPNALYSALTFRGGAAWRKRLMDDLGDQGDVTALLDRRSDDELAALMENLGGHCLSSLCEAFDSAVGEEPTLFLAYTIKGWGTPLAGHKDNHAGLMTPAQMETFRAGMGVAEGDEWKPFATVKDMAGLRAFLEQVPFFAQGARRFFAPAVPKPERVELSDRVPLAARSGFWRKERQRLRAASPSSGSRRGSV